MSSVFDVLDRMSQAAGGGSVPSWLATHPAPANRRQAIDQAITAMNRDFSGAIVEQPAYYRTIDTMVFGQDPREGYFDGTRFLHPAMKFTLLFPQGYRTVNQKGSVQGGSETNDALVELSLSAGTTPDAGLQTFLAQQGLTTTGGGVGRIHGFPTASNTFSVATQSGTVRGVVAFVDYGGRVFRLLGYATEAAWAQRESALRATLSSFDRLTDPAALQAQPKLLNIVNVASAQSFDAFANSYRSTVDVPTLALINQLETTARLQAGKPYKVVTGGIR
jgi:predicted Zn-dependent protease